MAKGLRKSKRKKTALLKPLLQHEIAFSRKHEDKMGSLRDLSLVQESYPQHPDSLNQLTFIAEVLHRGLSKQVNNQALYLFTQELVSQASHAYQANLHLLFLLKYIDELGFSPDWSQFQKGQELSIATGSFTNKSTHSLSAALCLKLHLLIGTEFDANKTAIFTGSERVQVLEFLIRYLEYHAEGFPQLKSIQVFTDWYRY